MGIGVSIFLIALGAILAFAVEFEASGLDINTVGVILMIVGAVGLATSFFFFGNRSTVGTTSRRTVTRDVVDDGVAPVAPRTAVRERTVVRDDQVL